MSTLVEQAIYMRGMNHSAPDRELRIEVHFTSTQPEKMQQAVLEAIDRMTHVVTDSLRFNGRVLKCRIDLGNVPGWQILDKLDQAEAEIYRTVKAVVKQFQTNPRATLGSDAGAVSTPALTLVGGSKSTKQRYSNNDPRSLPRRRR